MKTCYYREDFTHPESNFHFHLYNTDYSELHNHDYWEFFIILSGKTEHDVQGRKQLMSSGMGCLVHPRDKHRFLNASSGYQQMNICITDDYFKELLNVIDSELYGLISSINHPLVYDIPESTMNEIYKNIHSAQTTNNNDLVKFSNFLKLIWLDILKLIYRNSTKLNSNHPEWLNNFLQALQQPENLIMPVSEMHKLTYFSNRHLTRLFKEHMGETLSSYVQTMKINYAAMLLRTTDMGILPLSSMCGYDSLSHFIKVFKKHFNATPKEYRNSFDYSTDNGTDKPKD